MTTLEYLNATSEDAFVDEIGYVFEGSPWIARKAAARRPFADVKALHAAMVGVVAAASGESQVALIAAHPELAGKIAREGLLTASSLTEQAAAGLHTLTTPEAERFDELNAAYHARFAFPFVICVREHEKTSILAELERRCANERSEEIATALGEIAKIARLRLEEAIY
jgi:2-oxo-4-hydroxy-4-carboxy-5-ureidoimidazoline decarboxylase